MNRFNSNRQFDSQSVETIFSFAFGDIHCGGEAQGSEDFQRIDLDVPAPPWHHTGRNNSCNDRVEDWQCRSGVDGHPHCCDEAWSACQLASKGAKQNLVFELLPDGNCVLP